MNVLHLTHENGQTLVVPEGNNFHPDLIGTPGHWIGHWHRDGVAHPSGRIEIDVPTGATHWTDLSFGPGPA